MEQASQIHRHGGIHRLENGPATASRRILELTELVERTHGGFGHGVVSINNPDFVPVDIILIQTGMLKGCTRSHISILGFLRHELAQVPRHKGFQVRPFHRSTQSGTETRILALPAEYDAAFSGMERITHLIQCLSEARPYPHTCYYNSIFHNPVSIISSCNISYAW